jgi:hypothetical protein
VCVCVCVTQGRGIHIYTQRETHMGDVCGWIDQDRFMASLVASDAGFSRAEDAPCWHWEPARHLFRPDRNLNPLCNICHHDDGVRARATSRHLWCQRPKALMLRPSRWFSTDYPLPKLWPSRCLACGQGAVNDETVICNPCRLHIGLCLSQTLGEGPGHTVLTYLFTPD